MFLPGFNQIDNLIAMLEAPVDSFLHFVAHKAAAIESMPLRILALIVTSPLMLALMLILGAATALTMVLSLVHDYVLVHIDVAKGTGKVEG